MTQEENKFKWDKWQQEVLEHDGNITLRSGRQVGKSEVIGEKGSNFSLKHEGTVTLIIAASQRQSSLLFEKVRSNIDSACNEMGMDLYVEPPTLTKILLKNGSKIYCLPAGRTGHFIRGFTIDLLIADESAYIVENVWNSVLPMVAVSRKLRKFGHIILLSTPFGKGGYYYDSFTDKDFRSFHISSEDCIRIDKSFLLKEKHRMTKVEYAQEYLGEFTEEHDQLFPTALIKSCMSFIEWDLKKNRIGGSRLYLGLDIARYGGDENAFVIVEEHKGNLRAVKTHITERVSTTNTIRRTVKFDSIWKFNKIFTDDSGVGGGVTDALQDKFGRRVFGINNSSKRIQVQGEEKKRGILKEDLYSNVLMLMETGRLQLISDMDLLRSMKTIRFKYTEHGNIKIYGAYSHLTEALVRACWCTKERGLTPYIY